MGRGREGGKSRRTSGGGESDRSKPRMREIAEQEARRGEMDRFMGESRPAAMDGVVTSLDK